VSTIGIKTFIYIVKVGTDTGPIVLSANDIASSFSHSAIPECSLTTFISRAPTGDANLEKTTWSRFTSYDNSSDLVIDHHGNHGHSSNMIDFIYLRAVSAGNKEAFKTIQVNYIVSEDS
jgi:hypothetical protein